MIALLLDADNLMGAAVIDEVFEVLEKTEGPITLRRAYGSTHSLKGLDASLRKWAIRPFANLSLAKNTTDVAMAVDAMELAYREPRPRTVIIGSGDSDFVPLVVRLRERGVRVVCVCQQSTMAVDAVPAYDQVIYVGHEASEPAPVETTPVKDSAVATKKPAAKKATAKKSAAKKAAAKTPPAKKVVAKTAAVKTVSTPPVEVDPIAKILGAISGLSTGQWLNLNEVAKVLREQKLLTKNGSSIKLFRKHATQFELMPPESPTQVRYIFEV